ncbi:hypothetical protein UP10_02060 [Bradyrhizobium sp. LTSPM299]|uniref:hypothetical protein n=1 Tax=Bradyrhizobium sp. LTSPM299 TaxID=1619233 RepID=UPI0005C87CC8|nr:hypothetical protein [Bradyrhizobium sp. LTSPM299]KJC62178.1 hypothetical protein UP10_02060 [Bradyrhizobium sp. LTSPM299]
MFEENRFEWQLAKLQKEKKKLRASFAAKIAKSRKDKKSRDDREGLRSQEQFEEQELDAGIQALITSFLIEQANKLLVPIPHSETDWFTDTTFGERFLTAEARSKLRNDIRAEKKARWDLFQSHTGLLISLITATTGVLGTVIGVLSFMKAAPPPH